MKCSKCGREFLWPSSLILHDCEDGEIKLPKEGKDENKSEKMDKEIDK